MRTVFIVTTFILFCGKLFSQNGVVIIQVKGTKPKEGGALSVAFFNKNNFPKVGQQSFGVKKDITGSTMQIVFEKVPVGEYGIAIFQDIDRNDDLKTNFIGFPIEPFGFSNNARLKFGPPSFDNAKIIVENGKTINLDIQLR